MRGFEDIWVALKRLSKDQKLAANIIMMENLEMKYKSHFINKYLEI